MKKISLQETIEKFKELQIDKKDKYIITYPVFIKYFNQLPVYNFDNLLAGIAFVYSWMPRILTVKHDVLPALSGYCNQFKNQYDEEIETPLFEKAVEATGGSIVAASKLLHFMFPQKFPIFDSHIYNYCWDKEKSYHYQVKNPENYPSYRKMCLELVAQEEMADLQTIVTNSLKYPVSNLRALEFALYQIRKDEIFKVKNIPSKNP